MKPIFPILAAVAAAWSLATVPAQASNTFPASGYGQAYTASVILNSSLPSQTLAGPIAPAVLSCNVRTATNTNRVLSVALGSALISGTGTNTVTSTHTMSGATMQSTATVEAVNALGGLVTASAVHAVANSAASAAGASSNGNGSSFLNLIIAGIPVVANPAPNTTVSVPGIGSAVLNEQLLYTSASSTTFTVNMIHIRVTLANALGLKIGTNIIVAHATSSLTRMVTPTTVSASAYGLFAKGFAGNINLISGPFAPASIGCSPGNSTNQVLSTSSPLGFTGLMIDTASGSVTTMGSFAQGKSNISTTNILNNLVRADAIESLSQARLTNTSVRLGSTTLLNARIAGIVLTAHPAPNTRINIAGLGYVVLNEQSGNATSTSANEAVNAIHIYVTVTNAFNLPIQSSIIIGHSAASVTAF